METAPAPWPIHERGKAMQREPSEILNLDDTTFEGAVLPSRIPVAIQFTAAAPSRREGASRAFAEVAERFRGRALAFAMDGAGSPRTISRYAIAHFPTILVFRSGKVVRRFVGCPFPEELEMALRLEMQAGTAAPREEIGPAPVE